MNLTADQVSSPRLVEPLYHRPRRILAIVVIVVVTLGLFVSIFTQPELKTQETIPQVQQPNGEPSLQGQQSLQEQQRGNITKGLVWIGQIIISFIAVLSSIVELTGVNVRELFSSRAAKTNVEEFPFYVFQDYDKFIEYLFPDPKTPLLSDKSIKYLPQISAELDAALQSKGMILIRGRSKTGKTREACEMLRRWWYSGPTVLVVRSHVGLYPPFKIPENLPLRNLVIFFDDIDRYLGEASSLKRLDETLQFFQEICHNRGELRVVATVRQEDEFWDKLKFDALQAPWKKFELVQLNPLSPKKALEVINELSKMSGISIQPDLAKTLAEKNNGTFLNLALAFRGWLSQNIKTITSEEIKTFEGTLKNTWRRRYEELAASHPNIKPVYAAIDFMQTYNISLRPDLISEIATEMAMSKRLLLALGLIDRMQNWFDMSPLFNWYRDTKRRNTRWVIITVVGILIFYLLSYTFLLLVPLDIQVYVLDALAHNLSFQILCLLPVWIPIIPWVLFMLYSAMINILRNSVFRKITKTLEFLFEEEIPTRGSELRPYENQFEGNGGTNNWEIQNYAGEIQGKKFSSGASLLVTNRYLELAERLRVDGEFSSARKLATLAQKISPHHPMPLFILGKIEFGEGNFQDSSELLTASEKTYTRSNNVSRVQERLSLCYFLLDDYEKAEQLASKALKGMTDLITAAWVLILVQIKQENKQYKIPPILSSQSIPAEIQKILDGIDIKDKKQLSDIPSTGVALKNFLHKRITISGQVFLLSFASVLSLLFVLLVFTIVRGVLSQSNSLQTTTMLLTFFRSSILSFRRGAAYYNNGEYDKSIADYTEAMRLRPQIAFLCMDNACYTAAINLNSNPNSVESYFIRGLSYHRLNEYEKSIADYTDAIRLDRPDEYDKPLDDYRPQKDDYPDYLLYYTRGFARYDQGDLDGAIKDYAEAIRIYPNFINYCSNIYCYTAIISLDLADAQDYFNRGGIYNSNGEQENALADYTKSIQIDREIAKQCYDNPCYTAMINLNKNPSDSHAYIMRGTGYYGLQEKDKAFKDFKEAYRLALNESDLETLKDIQEFIGKLILEEAQIGNIELVLNWRSQLEQMQLPIKDANTLNSVCWYGSLWGYASQVLNECEQAVQLSPNEYRADIQDSRGLARALTGNLEGAILDFQYFVDNSDDSEAVAKRKLWIVELQKGNNPFTPEMLEDLKKECICLKW